MPNDLLQGVEDGADGPRPKHHNALLVGLPEEQKAASTHGNPLLEGLKGPTTPQPPPNLLDRIVQGTLIQTMKDIGNYIRFGFSGALPADVLSRIGGYDPEQGNVLTPEESQSATRGAAFVASMPIGGAVTRFVPGAEALLGRTGSFLTGEFLGGGVYGAVRPTEEGETRTEAVLGDAATFAATAGLIHGGTTLASRAFKRYILALPRAQRIAAIRSTNAGIENVESRLSEGGVSLSQLPPDEAAKIEEPILRQAIQDVEPNAVDLDEVVRREADRQLETSARLTEPAAGVSLPAAEQEVDPQFQEALARHREEEANLAKRKERETLQPRAGGGLEVVGTRESTGAREYPPSVTEILQGARRKYEARTAESILPPPPEPEKITGVALRGRSGQLYRPLPGEATHPQMLSRLFETGTPASEFTDQEGNYLESQVAGYSTDRRDFVSKENATKAGLQGATSRERVVGPVVRGKSGKVYVGGATHPEVMEKAIAEGASPDEFAEIDANADHPGRGFRTNLREFIDRETAARVAGSDQKRLFSEDFHAAGGAAVSSPEAAARSAEDAAQRATTARIPVYSGTKITNPLDVQFARSGIGGNLRGKGIYFTDDPEIASYYATIHRLDVTGKELNVRRAEINPQEFFDESVPENAKMYRDLGGEANPDAANAKLREMGYKGLTRQLTEYIPDFGAKKTTYREYIAFDNSAFKETGRSKLQGAHIPKLSAADRKLADRIQELMNKGEAEDNQDAYEEASKIIEQYGDKHGLSDDEAASHLGIEGAPGGRVAYSPVPYKDQLKFTVLDAATDHAVAATDPIKVSSPAVKQNKSVLDRAMIEPHPIPKPGKKLSELKAEMLNAALRREGSASQAGVTLELTNPTPAEIELERNVPPYVRKALRKEMEEGKSVLAQSLKRDRAPIETSQGEEIDAPWHEDPVKSPMNPKEKNGFEMGVQLDDQALNSLRDQVIQASKRAGFIQARLMIGIAGSGIEAIGFADDNFTPAEKTGLRALGAFMMLAAFGGPIAERLEKTQFVRNFLLRYNPAHVMSSPQAKELFRQYTDAMSKSRSDATQLRDGIAEVFKNKESWAPAMYAAEEGPSAPEWHMLTPKQQQVALTLQQMELRRGLLLKQEGVLDEYRENYVRHLLPPESFNRWQQTGFRMMPTGGGFTQPRKIDTLRELEAWAKKEGVPGPVMNPSAVYAFHSQEADHALGVVRLQKALESKGIVVDFKGSTPIPDGWRAIGVLGKTGKIAPEAVAAALENIAEPRASSLSIVNNLDTIKGYWMRSIMFWPWEHGLNVLRSLPAIANNPLAFSDAWKAIRDRDPGMVEAAKHGLDLFSRPDYGVRAHDGWQRLTSLVKLPSVGARVDRIQEHMDRWLWEQTVPSLQYFAYSSRMSNWAEQTGGKFLPGSAEYKVAARQAADFGNTVAGRIPQELTNPKLARLMRFALFSPQWTMTRIQLTASAAGDLAAIADGTLDPRHSSYLPFKLRQLAWGVAITAIGSELMSGKAPAFNPNNSKFYMNTGMRNSKGQEIGVDLIGWWETDLQVFNHPWNFIANRLNPALRVAQETIQGRDYQGREMTTGQKIGNIASSLGAGFISLIGAPLGLAARAANGPPLTGSDLVQAGFRASGVGATSTLPRAIDLATAKMSKKLLVRQGIPATDDNIFRLSILLKQNLNSGRNLIDGRVIDFLSYYKRSEMLRNPISSAISRGPGLTQFQPLWAEGRRILAEF